MKNLLLVFVASFAVSSTNAQCSPDGCMYMDAYLVDPNGTNNYDIDGVGGAESDDEFYQICNSCGGSVNISGWTVNDITSTLSYTFPGGTTVAGGSCVVLVLGWDGGGLPSGYYNQGAGGGALNNGGDTWYIGDGGSNYCSYCYSGGCPCSTSGNPGGTNQGATCTVEQDGCPTIWNGSAYVIAPGCTFSALPIELLDFQITAVSGNAKAKWKTASEIDNDYFTLERSSTNNRDWQVIQTVTSAGNSNTIREYEATDESVERGNTYYYRLKQTDLNGDFSYSSVKTIVFVESSLTVSEARYSETDILFNISNNSDAFEYTIIDLEGRVVMNSISFENEILLNKNDFESGLYFINVINGYKSISRKFVIQ